MTNNELATLKHRLAQIQAYVETLIDISRDDKLVAHAREILSIAKGTAISTATQAEPSDDPPEGDGWRPGNLAP